MAQKRLIFTSKWTTARHNGVKDASFNTALQSFDVPNAMEEARMALIRDTYLTHLRLS